MDFTPIVANLPPWIQTLIIAFFTLSYLCAHFCSMTAKPAPNTTWGKIYSYLEIFGGIYGKAKQIGIPVPEKPTVEDLMKRIAELEASAKGKKVDDSVVPVPSEVSPNHPTSVGPTSLINGDMKNVQG